MSRRLFLLYTAVWVLLGYALLQAEKAYSGRLLRGLQDRVSQLAQRAATKVPSKEQQKIEFFAKEDANGEYLAVQYALRTAQEETEASEKQRWDENLASKNTDDTAPVSIDEQYTPPPVSLYTLRVSLSEKKLRYVASSSESIRVGNEAIWQEEARIAFETKTPTQTGIYTGENEDQIVSAYAPILDKKTNEAIALVRVDQYADSIESRIYRNWLLTIFSIEVAYALLYLVWVMVATIRKRGLRLAYQESIQRIGVRVAVLFVFIIALGFFFLGYLSYKNAKQDLNEATEDKLRALVYTGTISIQGETHQNALKSDVSIEGDDISRLLNQFQERIGFNTEMYTVIRDEDTADPAYSVAITSQKDSANYPFQRQNVNPLDEAYNAGRVQVESTYVDRNGKNSYVSAYAPITDSQGKTVAVLVADQKVSDLLYDIENHSLWETAVMGGAAAILTVALVLLVMTSSISIPLQKLTDACRQIGHGDFTIELKTNYRNELGVLAKTLQTMLLELKDRERRLAREAQARSNYERFFPPQIVDQAAQENLDLFTPGGGRELRVTVLFADIRNYTRLSREMPPREVAEMLNEYFTVVVNVVFKHKGTLEKYIGDALMAIWGAPLPAEDQEARAVAAAIDMQRAIQELNVRWQNAGRSWNFEVGIGVNTGVCFVGNIGTADYLQYAAIGSTTNLAARLCSLAGPSEVVLSDTSREGLERTSAPIPLDEMPPFLAKGYDHQITPYRVRWE